MHRQDTNSSQTVCVEQTVLANHHFDCILTKISYYYYRPWWYLVFRATQLMCAPSITDTGTLCSCDRKMRSRKILHAIFVSRLCDTVWRWQFHRHSTETIECTADCLLSSNRIDAHTNNRACCNQCIWSRNEFCFRQERKNKDNCSLKIF